MMFFVKKINRLIVAKRKQILFALFAFLCFVFDKEDADNIMRAAAPAVVAGAAKAATAAKTAATATKSATAAKTAATAAQGVSTGAKAKTASEVASAKNKVDVAKGTNATKDAFSKSSSSSSLNRNMPKNTNPKSSGNLSSNTSSLGNNTSMTGNIESTSSSGGKSRTNYLMQPFVPSKSVEDDGDDEVVMENVSNQVVKNAPMYIAVIALFGLLLFAMLLPLMILGSINASSSSLSQIDCTKQQGDVCKAEDSEGGFFSKLKNLFKYGSYGSNSEVVLKEIEDSYDQIKEEYDFIISLSLLTSSIFTDPEYVKTEVENGQLVITDKMMERIEYFYPVAMLQLIPEYNVYTCEVVGTDSNGDSKYNEVYQYTKVPTYDEGDTTEEEMELIPTGECDATTAGGEFKKITYFFDDKLYFKRLKISEELDLVYPDYNDDDKLLVTKIANEYYLYKKVYNVDEELSYRNVPSHLSTDSNVNIQSPLSGWYSVTSPFGNREGEYAGMHTGIDLVSSNKNIYAAGDGVVTRSDVETEGGNVIEITHTDSSGRQYVTQYAHLSERHLNVGDVVNAGDVIGIMGDTGTMASGVHLHFAMWDKETNEYYNPRQLFSGASNY